MTTPTRLGLECPKHMTYGPCGGVLAPDRCEVDGRTCPFVEGPTTSWATSRSTQRPERRQLDRRFVADVRTTGEPTEDATVAALLGGVAIGLIGEHLDDDTGVPPSERVGALSRAGMACLGTVTGRGTSQRRRIGRLLEAGAVGVLCVTGDHPAARNLPQSVRFTSEGTSLASVARQEGSPLVAVAESPASPPHDRRVERLVQKRLAGADVAVLNHAGGSAATVAFVREMTAQDTDLGVVAPVPVITDRRSAEALLRFPGLDLPAGVVDDVLGAGDPVDAGVRIAAGHAAALLRHPGIDAVNLSGSASAGGPVERAHLMRAVIDATLDEVGS